jgi:hypothetical protein
MAQYLPVGFTGLAAHEHNAEYSGNGRLLLKRLRGPWPRRPPVCRYEARCASFDVVRTSEDRRSPRDRRRPNRIRSPNIPDEERWQPSPSFQRPNRRAHWHSAGSPTSRARSTSVWPSRSSLCAGGPPVVAGRERARTERRVRGAEYRVRWRRTTWSHCTGGPAW